MCEVSITDARDRKFLDWLRTQPCCVTRIDWKPSDPAHVFKTFFGGGVAIKSTKAVPLCHDEHLRQSNMPEVTYWRNALKKQATLLLSSRQLMSMRHPAQFAELERTREYLEPVIAHWYNLIDDDILVKQLVGLIADEYVRAYEIEKGLRAG
jgi:hypothetical protein